MTLRNSSASLSSDEPLSTRFTTMEIGGLGPLLLTRFDSSAELIGRRRTTKLLRQKRRQRRECNLYHQEIWANACRIIYLLLVPGRIPSKSDKPSPICNQSERASGQHGYNHPWNIVESIFQHYSQRKCANVA